MKTKKIAILAIVAIAALVLYFLPSKKSTNTNYQTIIPKEASLVASFDVPSLIKKGDIPGWISGNKRLQKYLGNPKDLGIDFDVPAYVFVGKEGEYAAFVCSLLDDQALEAKLNDISKVGKKCKAPISIEGLKAAKVFDADIFYNDNTVLLLFSDTTKVQSTGLAKRLFSLQKDERFTNTTEGQDLQNLINDTSLDNDITGTLNYSALKFLPKEYHVFLPLPSSISPENVRARIYGNFMEGDCTLYYQLYGTTDEKKTELGNYADKLVPLNGNFTNLADKNCVVYGTVNLNEKMASNAIDRIYAYLKNDEDLKFLTQGPNADKVIGKLKCIATETKGDAAFSIGIDEEADFPISVSVASHLKSTKFLADAPYWMNYINKNSQIINEYLDAENGPNKLMEKIDATNYAINLLGTRVKIGVSDSIFYLTTKQSVKGMITASPNDEIAERLFKGPKHYGFIMVNFENIKDYASDFSNFGSVAEICDHLTYGSHAPLEGYIKLELTNKDKNAFGCLLKQLF